MRYKYAHCAIPDAENCPLTASKSVFLTVTIYMPEPAKGATACVAVDSAPSAPAGTTTTASATSTTTTTGTAGTATATSTTITITRATSTYRHQHHQQQQQHTDNNNKFVADRCHNALVPALAANCLKVWAGEIGTSIDNECRCILHIVYISRALLVLRNTVSI
jgi:hypothetical protein